MKVFIFLAVFCLFSFASFATNSGYPLTNQLPPQLNVALQDIALSTEESPNSECTEMYSVFETCCDGRRVRSAALVIIFDCESYEILDAGVLKGPGCIYNCI